MGFNPWFCLVFCWFLFKSLFCPVFKPYFFLNYSCFSPVPYSCPRLFPSLLSKLISKMQSSFCLTQNHRKTQRRRDLELISLMTLWEKKTGRAPVSQTHTALVSPTQNLSLNASKQKTHLLRVPRIHVAFALTRSTLLFSLCTNIKKHIQKLSAVIN